ncbi:MAG: class I mannose-6-phosphate isomerase [Gemmatimonadota bacterium]|nr:class I mannose-6-phosphate isomerase [Gemmatimonadota bacterium]MDE2983272.1 class I mannose-6-phosphate isomerase [Gemmatimonadota bacterium]
MPTARPALAAPLTFAPRLKHYLWGGRRLEGLFGRCLPGGVTAESWEVSGYPGEPSVVEDGPLAGRELPDLVAEYGIELLGRRGSRAAEKRTFPLLVKLLDASHALSVQVHPDDGWAAAHRTGEPGKDEMWHILHADPGAGIIHGLAPGVDRAALRRAVAERRVQDALNRVAVRPGDSVMVPAGTVHGILSGVVLLEVQQASDTTYRIHDWDRLGPDGRPRELHLDRALEVIDYGRRGAALVEPRVVEASAGVLREVVAACRHFVVERIRADAGANFGATLDGASCEIWGAVAGTASLRPSGAPALDLAPARFVLLPATMGPFTLRAHTETVAIRVFLP